MKRTTIKFPDDVAQAIENFRGHQRPIPSFNKTVVELVERGLEAKKE